MPIESTAQAAGSSSDMMPKNAYPPREETRVENVSMRKDVYGVLFCLGEMPSHGILLAPEDPGGR